ncbi:MAG: MoaF N-terminal domain-containing protein [Colwellia sp.]|nr:MoaF N-terminal domain-containing protein [Colwellia sp.]
MSSNTVKKTWVENYHLRPDGHPLTADLVGKAVRLHYKSGHVLEQHWLTDHCVLWKGISGGLDGHSQKEKYNAVNITENIFLITWIEESTTTRVDGPDMSGPWLTDVVLDFDKMIATASWMGPTDDNQVEHVLDQATMSYIECDEPSITNE